MIELPILPDVQNPLLTGTHKHNKQHYTIEFQLGVNVVSSPSHTLVCSQRRYLLFIPCCLSEHRCCSMLTVLEKVFPRCVKELDAWRICFFVVMCGSQYYVPGAGWNITSGFLILMVRPKLLHAVVVSECICEHGKHQAEERQASKHTCLTPGDHLESVRRFAIVNYSQSSRHHESVARWWRTS